MKVMIVEYNFLLKLMESDKIIKKWLNFNNKIVLKPKIIMYPLIHKLKSALNQYKMTILIQLMPAIIKKKFILKLSQIIICKMIMNAI